MQAVRPSAREEAEEEPLAQAQEVKEEVKGEVVKAKAAEEEVAPEEKEVAVVGEEKAEADEEAEAGVSVKKNRIQVSTNKKPLYFYVNLAKVRITTHILVSSRLINF